MSVQPQLVQAPERVLPTLNVDGSRRWLRPRPSPGAFQRRRRIVAYALMLVFFAIPYVTVHGRPLVLLDLPHRTFTILGTTFLPTETVLFMLLFLSCVVAIFFFTALFGRVWCGWACPQTVYMEFLFRPIEYAIEGGPRGTAALDGKPFHPRRLLKHLVFVALALFLAHTFLAYFVGVRTLAQWVTRSPVHHWTSFTVMLGTTALVAFDFGWFREQTCMVACPYGRLQSVLLDRKSWIVGYDARRGEPRALGVRDRAATAGDCINCRMCVQTCPTGIDIRDGLQMECIHCTQCMDACDTVMVKIGKPIGLIRYGSRDGFEGRPSGWMRARVLLYPIVLVAALALLGVLLALRTNAEVTVLRGLGVPYTIEADGSIVNQLRVRVADRSGAGGRYRIDLVAPTTAKLIAPLDPLPVGPGETATTSVFVVLPPGSAPGGVVPATLRFTGPNRFLRDVPYRLVVPESSPGDPGQPR